MTFTLRVNARNDIHLNAEVLEAMNLGEERVMKAELKDNALILIPVDLEPRYSQKELDAMDRLHAREKKKGFIYVDTKEDIDKLFKKSKKR